ncbi:MAG: prolyl oligopeptidase family serine peptidase [Planctomycetota bacterium]
MRVAGLVLLFVASVSSIAGAQATRDEHARVEQRLKRWRGLAESFDPVLRWRDDGSLWFEEPGAGGAGQAARVFVLVARDGAIRRASDPAKLGIDAAPREMQPRHRAGPSSSGGRAVVARFINELAKPVRIYWLDSRGVRRGYGELAAGAEFRQNTFAGHSWLFEDGDAKPCGAFVISRGARLGRINEASQARVRTKRVSSPVSQRRPRGGAEPPAFVRGHNIWLRAADGSESQLSDDGSAADGFRGGLHLSPGGQHVLAFRVVPGEERLVHMVESSPRDQVQPRLHSKSYRKPGDRIDQPRPVLFDLERKAVVPVDPTQFADAWSIGRVRWSPDGSEAYCLYNRRGHQRLCVYAIDASSGKVRTVLEERSDTFVDYSQKTVFRWLADGRHFLWASERDGWNHLYVCDAQTGGLRQLTKGKWLVRSLEHIDEAAGVVWFATYGIYPNQDPYHRHLARIDLDGSNLRVVSAADGDHEWQFSPDRSRVVLRYSRVDLPWVTELRLADGSLLAELGRDRVDALLAAGFRPPVRFAAKGRDGKTDIWGVLILPSDLDPTRRYPVIEDIYAGPHDHHVPKQWGASARQRRLAELGFIVVRIDGMGTNWRQRAFHDVCWRNLKDAGLPDRIAWMRSAARTRPWMDLERVGIFGGSAGGQSALAALLHHGEFYDVAVADCGCHDNRMDKIWWNEAWMGWPIGPWYADSSNVTHASKLTGRLLLTVGELDRNVDPASTMQVADALIRADRDFDLIVVPGAGHGVGETRYLVRRRADFFVQWLRR